MSFPYTPNLLDEKLESMQTQHDYLNLLRLRHLQWMQSAEDPEVETMHSEIAGLIEQITDQYRRMSEVLKTPSAPAGTLLQTPDRDFGSSFQDR